MTKIIRTDSDNKDFIELVKYLDADLAVKDGDQHSFYNQFNKILVIRICSYYFDHLVSVCFIHSFECLFQLFGPGFDHLVTKAISEFIFPFF